MSENVNIEEAKKALQDQLENLKNKTYPDWDNVIVQLNLGDQGVANIRMMRQDMEAIQMSHGQGQKDVMDLLFQALEEQLKNRE